MDLIIDTREQTPWSFPQGTNIQYQKLDAGDYALSGDQNFSIERKSLDDFVGTITRDKDRFDRELERMKDYPAKIVIVEGCISDCVFKTRQGEIIPPVHSHYMITPQFITKRIAELALQGVCILFCENAELASAIAYKILKERSNAIKS